ncbi:MAG: magnesium transporter CorA family protein [Gaiellales bacterium]
MTNGIRWIDLLDPDRQALEQAAPEDLHPRALDQLLEPARHDDEPRPTLESHGDYIFGVFLVAVADREQADVYYQEIDLVLTRTTVLTVCKTPPDGRRMAFKWTDAREAYERGEMDSTAMIAYHLVDDVAERYLDLTDAFNDKIDDLEDHVEVWPPDRVREQLSTLRHDLLHIRRTLSPTRDAVRRVVDNRIELEGAELFVRDVELHFADAYDKLLRAYEALELSRDLVASVRDYHVAKIANDQNEVMKRLTVVASVLLLPTFIVGLYGQNFHDIPELRWRLGYGYVWALIIVTTGLQLWYFRRKRWI